MRIIFFFKYTGCSFYVVVIGKSEGLQVHFGEKKRKKNEYVGLKKYDAKDFWYAKKITIILDFGKSRFGTDTDHLLVTKIKINQHLKF